MRVSLVGTVHVDSGLANAVELQAIIERLNPSVIFAEVSSAQIAQYVYGSHGTIESVAVASYREGRELAVIPVDLPKPSSDFFFATRDMFRVVEKTSHEYRRLVDRHSADTQADGFAYLNSDHCMHAWSAIHRETVATLDWIQQPRFHESYARWCSQNQRRDTAIVGGITEYAAQHSLVHGLLLVGAAHRKSVGEKAQARRHTDPPRIEWQLENPFESKG